MQHIQTTAALGQIGDEPSQVTVLSVHRSENGARRSEQRRNVTVLPVWRDANHRGRVHAGDTLATYRDGSTIYVLAPRK